ncbi:glycosyltransferase family 4 protein, partial [Escherichia coli]|nr:glycosyltransferase family 4 protein [Escherichia coli]
MKILIVNTFFYPNEIGGAEFSCKVLAEALAERGHDVSVLSTTNGESRQTRLGKLKLYYLKLSNVFWHGKSKKQGAIKGIIWHAMDSFNPIMFFKLLKLFKEIRPDVIHTNNIVGFSCSLWFAALVLNIPVVHTLRDYYLKCYRSCMRKNNKNCDSQCVACKLLTTPRKIISSNVNAVIGNSQYMINSHLKNNYFSNTPMKKVIFNAWNPSTDLQKHQNLLWQRVEHARFGFIGRITEEKGIELLLRSFKNIKNQPFSNKISLIVAGEGDDNYIKKLSDEYSDTDGILFVGKVEPEDFYKRIDFTIVPSLWEEPLARVVFESFFFSLPVLTTARGGNAEVVKHGQNGFIFSETVESLSATMQMALNVNYIEMSKAAFYSRLKFTNENLVSSYENIYRRIKH